MSSARKKLRRWLLASDPAFRDLVYEWAVVKVDLDTPKILAGITGKAKRGNVQAARLALEVTGRHNPKGENAPTQVVVAFTGIPRPEGMQVVEAIDGEAEELDG